MKLRNQLLALACLALFAAGGWLYVKMWVLQKKPFGIVLFVSDGMVARQLTMARLYDGGADHQLALESFPNLALLRNGASDFAVPDDASAGTALATGQRTGHRSLAVDGEGHPLRNIAELARAHGRVVGLVTNGSLAEPTPAAFYAHATDAREREKVAVQLLEGGRPNVVLGGGAIDFLPPAAGGRRRDDRNLVEELSKRGTDIVRTKAELEDAGPSLSDGIVGLFGGESLAYASQIESGSQQPSLADMTRRAITFLQQNGRGYLLIVDAELIGAAASRNEGERTITETIALDRAVGTAMKYAGKNSLFLSVGRHSTGGLTLNGYPQRQDHGVALLGTSPEGYPYLTWATGPNGPAAAAGALSPAAGAPGSNAHGEPAAAFFPSALNNAEDVLALGQGPGSEKLQGVQDNTVIYQIIKDAL